MRVIIFFIVFSTGVFALDHSAKIGECRSGITAACNAIKPIISKNDRNFNLGDSSSSGGSNDV